MKGERGTRTEGGKCGRRKSILGQWFSRLELTVESTWLTC